MKDVTKWRAQIICNALALCLSLSLQPAISAQSASLIVEFKDGGVTAADGPGAAPAGSSNQFLFGDATATGGAAKTAVTSRRFRKSQLASAASTAALSEDQVVSAWTSSVSVAAASSGIQVLGQTRFSSVLKGAAIRLKTIPDAQKMKQQLMSNPMVKNVWYAETRHVVSPIVHNTSVSDNPVNDTNIITTPNTTTGSVARPETAIEGSAIITGWTRLKATPGMSGLTGAGSLICVIDSGISYNSPEFGSCTGVGEPRGQCKVVTGYDFVGDSYNGRLDGPAAVRGGPPTDCMGHGTMVASVAASSNGVAPGALLGSYRVFGCSGFASDDVIIEAIDLAVSDGCDIINLALSTGSGYDEQSVYSSVMRNAISQGVLVVKAAGNDGGDGPFRADAYTAAGSITAASVGDDVGFVPLNSRLVAAHFSSYGPDPGLRLLPHVSAPGVNLPVINMRGAPFRASGTSMSAPYISGVLATWLQYQQRRQSTLSPPPDSNSTVSQSSTKASHSLQAAALRGLVSTARQVPTPDNKKFLEPVAKSGAGLLQVDAFFTNQLRVTPLMINLPSDMRQQHINTTVRLQWQGLPVNTSRRVVMYDISHVPAAAMTLSNGWYGTDKSIEYVYEAAEVNFQQQVVAINTSSSKTRKLQVTFSVPPSLLQRPLLYSGFIRLTPRHASSDDDHLPAVVVPYQGFTQSWSVLKVLARPRYDISKQLATDLRKRQSSICYAPGSQPKLMNSVLDILSPVPLVCSGGFTSSPSSVLNVSLAALQSAPDCSLRITLVPELPLRTLYVELLNSAGNETLGTLDPLATGSGSSLAPAQTIPSFCLKFNGTFTAHQTGKRVTVKVGRTYKLRALLRGPVPAADSSQGVQITREQVNIRGKFKVIS